jgi:hypothetical protein
MQRAHQLFNQQRRKVISEMRRAQRRANVSGRLHPETLESLSELIRINTLGFLTHDSQQGIVRYGQVPQDRRLYAKLLAKYNQRYWRRVGAGNYDEEVTAAARREYAASGGAYARGITDKERAYLVGYMERRAAHWLTRALNQQSNVVAFATEATSSAAERAAAARPLRDVEDRIGVTYEVAHQNGYASPFDEYPLFPVTALAPGGNEPISSATPLPSSADRYYAQVTIMDARYGHHVRTADGLFKQVIGALEALRASRWQNWRRR